MMAFTERAAGLAKVRKILRKEYGKQVVPVADCVARQILWFILLERSSAQQVEQALQHVDQAFVDLNELRVSLPREVAANVAPVADAEAKAYRVTRIFNALFLLKNTMEWGFVRTMGVRELRQFFEKLDGGDVVLGAAMAMFFSSGHAVPADADLLRTLQRLGLTEEGEGPADVQSFLERAVSKEEGGETWMLLHRLGETVCLPGEPVCEKCPVSSICPTGQQRLAAQRQKKASGGGRSSRSQRETAGTKARADKAEPKSAKAKPSRSTAAQKAPAKVKPAAAGQKAAKVKPAAKTARATESGTTGRGKAASGKESKKAEAAPRRGAATAKGGKGPARPSAAAKKRKA